MPGVSRDRYHTDSAYRERVKAASRRHYHKTARTMTEEQRETRRANARRRYAEDPRRVQSALLKKKYGITLDDYDRMLEKQEGRCRICDEQPNDNKRLAVDHCHATGRVRGLLCARCNRGIGVFGDDTELLGAAVRYLRDGG